MGWWGRPAGRSLLTSHMAISVQAPAALRIPLETLSFKRFSSVSARFPLPEGYDWRPIT